MFCPKCGQQRLSTETSFCSRCGFLLTGTADLLQTGGLIPRTLAAPHLSPSPRSRGIKKGGFVLLLTFLIVPLLTVLSIMANVRSPAIVIVATIFLVVGGLLRMAYAAMFESPVSGATTAEHATLRAAKTLSNPMETAQLPPQQTYPVSGYAPPVQGGWRNTNELEPHSITDGTTRLLEKEETPQ